MSGTLVLKARELARHAQRIATATGCHVVPRPVPNPTLVAHGLAKAARWHILTHEPPRKAVADLYIGTRAEALRVARLMANMLAEQLDVLDNSATPADLRAHPRAVTGGNPRRNRRGRNPRAASLPADARFLGHWTVNGRRWEVYRDQSRQPGAGGWQYHLIGARGAHLVLARPSRMAPPGTLDVFRWTGTALKSPPSPFSRLRTYESGGEGSGRITVGTASFDPTPTPNQRGRNPRGGARVVYNRLLGGWYVVRGAHQFPLAGPFYSKAEAQTWLATPHELRRGPNRSNPRALSVPERHQLKIARDTLKMTEAMARVMGGPSHAEARRIILELTGKPAPNPSRSKTARAGRAHLHRTRRKLGRRVYGRPFNAAKSLYYLEHRAARSPAPNPKGHDPELDEAVRRIRTGLQRRGGVRWSVTRGTGSVYGWIYVKSPRGDLTPDEAKYLGKLLGLAGHEAVHHQGVMIPPLERDAFVARAEGKHSGPRPMPNPKAGATATQRRNARALFNELELRSNQYGKGIIGYKALHEGNTRVWEQARALGVADLILEMWRKKHPLTPNPKRPLSARGKASRRHRARATRRTPRANPRQPFAVGERVTVPYTGRLSYFGRKVKRTREGAIVQGVDADGTVHVSVKRGKGFEQHQFAPDAVRRRPQVGRPRGATRIAGAKARLELKAQRVQLAAARREQARAASEFGCLEAKAKAVDFGTPEYTALRGKMSRLATAMEARGAIIADLERRDPRYVDPWMNPRPKRGGSAVARAARVFRIWQDRGPIAIRTRKMRAPKPLVAAAAELGKVVAVTYRSDKHDGRVKDHEHVFKPPLATLATDPAGRDLHIIRGRSRYAITADGIVN